MAAGVCVELSSSLGLDGTARPEFGRTSCAGSIAQAPGVRAAGAAGLGCLPVIYCVRLPDRYTGIPNKREDFMSKSSTVTVRERPVEEVASAKAGGLVIHGETIIVSTDQRIELVDLTNRIMEFARRFNIREGLVSLWSMHTTCSLFINEFQTALLTDIKRFLEQMVARDAEWMHNNPEHSDCDRMNADSHLRALMLGHSLTLQVSGGEVVLGQWQRILMAELDGPRARTLRIQIWGIS
jgi:secondary thiamine-phosphate synthase enzyme